VTSSRPSRLSLYTASEKRPFTCTIECSSCREETRVSYLELSALMFPLHLHLPMLKRHPSWLKCPSCGRRTWVRIRFSR